MLEGYVSAHGQALGLGWRRRHVCNDTAGCIKNGSGDGHRTLGWCGAQPAEFCLGQQAARGGALPGGHDTDLRELGGGCEFIA